MDPITAKDWQLLALGSLFSFLISLLLASLPDLRALYGRLTGNSPEERPLLKSWHSYHFTRNDKGRPYLRYERWDMHRRFFGLGRLAVKTHDPKFPELKYRATVRREHNTVVFFAKADHIETWYARFQYPLAPTEADRICGVMSGMDFKFQPYATTVLVAAQQVSDDEAIRFLNEHSSFHAKEWSLRTDMPHQ